MFRIGADRDLLVDIVEMNEEIAMTCRAVSDRVAVDPRAASLMANGMMIFGERNRFVQWLMQANAVLQGKSPLDVLASGDLQSLEDELVRIEYGDLIAEAFPCSWLKLTFVSDFVCRLVKSRARRFSRVYAISSQSSLRIFR